MGWHYLSIPKLQRCNRWSWGMDELFHPTFHWACDYLSMLGLKLINVSKRGHLQQTATNKKSRVPALLSWNITYRYFSCDIKVVQLIQCRNTAIEWNWICRIESKGFRDLRNLLKWWPRPAVNGEMNGAVMNQHPKAVVSVVIFTNMDV